MVSEKKYKFYLEINGEQVEWTNLTQRTAKMMYNTTLNNCRMRREYNLNFGWEVQE